MPDKLSLPQDKSGICNSIKKSDSTPALTSDEMDKAWTAVRTVLEEKAQEKRFKPWPRKLIPAAGFGIAAAAAVLIFTRPFGILELSGKPGGIQITRFSEGLRVEKNGREIHYENNPVINPGETVINDSGQPAVFAAENSFRAVLSPEGRAAFLFVPEKDTIKTAVRMEKGYMDFHVKKLTPDESFLVFYNDKTLSVIGTVFRVSLTNHGMLVAAEEGKVSVTRGNDGRDPLFISKGNQVFIPDNGKPELSPVPGNISSSLASFSGEGLSRSSNNTALLVVRTAGTNGTVYINGNKICRTPAGMEIPKYKSFDMEIVGDNGAVVRMPAENLKSDMTANIDYNRRDKTLLSAFPDNAGTPPKMAMTGNFLAAVKGKDGIIYDFGMNRLLRIPGKDADWKIPPVINNGRILMIGGGAAECFNGSGNKLWSLPIEGTFWYGAVCAYNGSLYAATTVDRGIIIFDDSGRMIENIGSSAAGPGYSSTVLDDDDILYYVNEANHLTAYSVREKREIWRKSLPSVSAHPLLESASSIIIYFRDKGAFYAYSKKDGRTAWTLGIPETARQDVRIAINDGILSAFINSGHTGKIWLIETESGRLLEEKRTSSAVSAVMRTRASLWIATADLLLINYDVPSGKAIRRFHLESEALDIKARDNSLIVLTGRGFDRINLK